MLRKEKIAKLILIIVLILVVIFGILYYFFGSKERQFLKSISLIENPIQYLTYSSNANFHRLARLQNYEKTGTLNISLDGYNQISVEDNIEDSSEIKVNGKVNGFEKLGYINLDWVSGENEILKANIIKDDEKIGIKSEEVVNGYVSIENNNLNDLFEKIEIDFPYPIQQIEMTILIDLFQLEEIEKEALGEYKTIVSENTKSKNYEKVKETFTIIEKQKNVTGYKLSLSKEELKNLLIPMFEELKQDSITLNMISQKMRTIGFSEDDVSVNQINAKIDELQQGLLNGTVQLEDFSITIFKYKKDFLKTEIIYGDTRIIITQDYATAKVTLDMQSKEKSLSVEKAIEGDSKTVTQIIAKNEINKEITIKIEAEQKSNGVRNLSEIYLKDQHGTAEINYIEENTFIEEIEETELEELNEQNSIVLNHYTKEELNSLLEAVKNQIEVVFQNKQTQFWG